MLDPESAVKKNNLKPISNPVFFDTNNKPTSDGLLSNEIFGITMSERANIFAYIDLFGDFISPLHYEILTKLDSNFRSIVHGTETFIIDSQGYLVKDPNGETGIKFLKKNIDVIKIKSSESNKRDDNIKFIEKNKSTLFIKKMLVIPAYYRDVNTTNGTSSGFVGVGDINKLYNTIIIAVRALRDSDDYGLTIANSTRGRIQEGLLTIYRWFEDQLSKKTGIIRRANITKTTDHASRLVLSSADLNVETLDDMMVNMEYSALPLSAICTSFYPFVIFNVRRFFENEFSGNKYYDYFDAKTGKVVKYTLKNTNIEFSDERIMKELNRFMHGYSNRFIPVRVPVEEKPGYIGMKFKGRQVTPEQYAAGDYNKYPIMDRVITWCDIFFIAATEAVRDKTVLITRFPIDTYFNQFPSKIEVNSTQQKEPMIIDNTFYKYYPKIRQEDIGMDTSNMFVDTCIIANPYTDAMGADFDGDTVIIKGMYTIEANEELLKQSNSKSNYISLGGRNIRITAKEGIQALYNLTLVLPDTKLTDPIF